VRADCELHLVQLKLPIKQMQVLHAMVAHASLALKIATEVTSLSQVRVKKKNPQGGPTRSSELGYIAVSLARQSTVGPLM